MGRPIKHWHKYRYDEFLNKWVRKKRYKHPVITVVKLDPDQALLVQCKVSGAYITGQWCDRRGPLPTLCRTPVKGVQSRISAGPAEHDLARS